MQTPPIVASLLSWIVWITIMALVVTRGWDAGQMAHQSPPPPPSSLPTVLQLTPPPTTLPTAPPPPTTPPPTAGPLTVDYLSTFHYDPYLISFCFVVRLVPSELPRFPVFLASLASGQYANLRLWLLGPELTKAMWATVKQDIDSIHLAFGRRFAYMRPGEPDNSTESLPPSHRRLLQAEQLAATLAAAKYGHLLTEHDPECYTKQDCYNPPLADLSAPLCDYIVHTTAAHFYNVQFAEALRKSTDAMVDVIAFDFVSRKEEAAGACVARQDGGLDSQVFAQWRAECLRLAAIAFRGKYLLTSGKHFIEEEERYGAGRFTDEYYGVLLALRMLREGESALVHRVLVFEQ